MTTPKKAKSAKTAKAKKAIAVKKTASGKKKTKTAGRSSKHGMSGKRAKNRRKPAKKTHRRYWPLVLIPLFVAAALYIWVINDFIEKNQSDIEIYSSSLEVYSGKLMSIKVLQNYLDIAGFVADKRLAYPYRYVSGSNKLQVYLPAFDYLDEHHGAQKILFVFEQGRVQQILSLQGRGELGYIRLPPVRLLQLEPGKKLFQQIIGPKALPTAFVKLLLLVEDKRFYQHIGIDLLGIARALWVNFRSGRVVQGASTLTQQYVKNTWLGSERSYWRKIKEALISLALESYFSKQQILLAYINHVYMGQKGSKIIKGFQAASRYYFSKNLNNLDMAEMASLVAMVKAPASYEIKRHNPRALARRNLILKMAAETGMISSQQAKALQQKPLGYLHRPDQQQAFSAYLGLVRYQLQQQYPQGNWRQKGRKLFTHLDIVRQIKLQQAVSSQLARFEQQKQLPPATLQAAVLVIDKNNGHIEAALGGRDDSRFGWNRLLNMKRQPGSLIKPFVYYTALAGYGYHANSLVADQPVTLKLAQGKIWQPENYDHKIHGNIPLWQALARSYNLATVNLGLETGIAAVQQTLYQCGYKETLPDYPSLLLGAVEMSPFEMASLYQVIASGGFKAPLTTLEGVLQNGSLRLLNRLQSRKVLKPAAVNELQSMLHKVVTVGTARSLNWRLPGSILPLAAKTGTSNRLRDSWFVAWDQRYLTLVWLGRDDNKPSGFSGSSGALVLFAAIQKAYMSAE